MASSNWANTPGPTPGSDSAVHLQKAIAGGADMPATKRRVKVQLRGSKTGCASVPGLYSKR